MTHRVLIIDNNFVQACGDCHDFHKRVAWPYQVVRPFDRERLPDPKDFSHIILTGGNGAKARDKPKAMLRELDYIRACHVESKPMLGICLGMELIAIALAGDDAVRTFSSAEIGWVRIRRIGESRLLDGLPETFSSFANHVSEAIELPPGFRAIARTRRVEVDAFEHSLKPTFGIQFHPEKTPAKTLTTVRRRKRQDIPSRWFIDPYTVSAYDRTVGQKIFDNFFAQ